VTRRPGPIFAALLALALLAAQGLGLAHRVAHGPLASSLVAAEDDGAHFGGDHFGGAHERGSAECRLVDQTAQGDALPVAALPALPPRVPAPLPARLDAQRGEALALAPLARGPPACAALRAADSFDLTV